MTTVRPVARKVKVPVIFTDPIFHG